MKRLAILGACALICLSSAGAQAAEPTADALQASRNMSGEFFGLLKSGQVKQAYVTTFPNLQQSKPADMQNLAGQTETILTYYGRIIDWEELKVDAVSPHLVSVTYMLRTENGPVFFKLSYYRNASKWVAVNIYVADAYANLSNANF